MIELREHQKDCIDALRNSLARGIKHLLVKAPCSFGKTIVFCEIAKNVSRKDKKTLIVVDNVALVRQTVEKLKNFVSENEVGIYCSTLKEKNIRKITVCTIQSIKKNDFDLIILDEVHAGLSRFERFLSDYSGIVIGFTATPFNNKGVKIYGEENSFFPELTYSINAKLMIANGFITPMKYGGESEETKVDLSDLKIVRGDYDMGKAEEAYLKQDEKMRLQIDDMLSRIKDRKRVIIMTTGIKHANRLSELLDDSVAYHSDILDEERNQILKDFESGKYKFLIGVMAIYKGLDITCVDTIVNMRPMRSYPLFIQLAGRAVRLHGGKNDALFLDYGQTVEKLGFYEEFDEKTHNHKKRTGEAPIKSCPMCKMFMYASCMTCVDCGFEFPKKEFKTLDKLSIVAYTESAPKEGVITSVVFHDSVFSKRINCLVRDNKGEINDVDFTYTKNSDYALRLFNIFSKQIKVGKNIIYKLEKNKYYNIVRIYDWRIN